MYHGHHLKFKSFSEGASFFAMLFTSFSVILVLLYLWAHYVSKPVDLSSLNRIEGSVIEKLSGRVKYQEVCSFRIKIENDIKRYRVPTSNSCRRVQNVPLNKEITALVHFSWINGLTVHQILENNQLVFSSTLLENEKKENDYLKLIGSAMFFILGVIAYGLGFLFRKGKT